MLWEWIVAADPHWTVFTKVSLKRGWKYEGEKKNIHIHTGVTSINISHKASWDHWSLLQDNSGAHWQARLGILRNGTQAPATEKKLRLRPVELSPLELALNEVCCFTLHRCTYHLSFKVVICEKWLKFSPKISRKDGLA